MSPKPRGAAAVLLLAAAMACAGGSFATVVPVNDGNAAETRASTAWDAVVAEFIETTFELDPTFAVSQGRHEYDGRIPRLDEQAIRQRAAHYRHWQKRAAEIDVSALAEREAFERELLEWWCGAQLFWIERARWPFRNPAYYFRFFSPTVYVSRAYAPLPERLAALTRHSTRVPEALAQVKANLAGPLPRSYVDYAMGFFGGLAAHLEHDVPAVFAPVKDPALQAAFSTASAKAISAYRETTEWLRGRRPSAGDDFALGVELYREMLERTELIERPLDELAAMNARDKARNRAALDDACRALDAKATTEECVARVSANKPEEGPVERGAEQLPALERFIVERDLVGIPLPDDAHVAEAPPYRRANLAYIERPGPYEQTELPSIYYIAPPDPSWSAEEQRAYLPSEAALTFISIHEVWPGHFLQGLHERAHAGPLGRLLNSGVFTEGWAHYTEEMMWDAGFGNGDPALHVGQLLQALWRNVRFESAIGLHTGTMTLADSERRFREDAFLDPGNARQQAARGTYDPGYLAYTLGKLEIMALRDEWLARGGERAGGEGWKAFHDALLSYGAPPLPLVRKYLLAGLEAKQVDARDPVTVNLSPLTRPSRAR